MLLCGLGTGTTPPVVGHKFSIGAASGDTIVGVVIVGRPVSRHRDDGETLEVTRLCTDGSPNVCSFLYGKAARALCSWLSQNRNLHAARRRGRVIAGGGMEVAGRAGRRRVVFILTATG